jgi:hypothetical protein
VTPAWFGTRSTPSSILTLSRLPHPEVSSMPTCRRRTGRRRDVAQFGSAFALGAKDPRFKSGHPDKLDLALDARLTEAAYGHQHFGGLVRRSALPIKVSPDEAPAVGTIAASAGKISEAAVIRGPYAAPLRNAPGMRPQAFSSMSWSRRRLRHVQRPIGWAATSSRSAFRTCGSGDSRPAHRD